MGALIVDREQLSAFGKLTGVFLAASIVLGGSSFHGKLGDVLLQLLSIGILAVGVVLKRSEDRSSGRPRYWMPLALTILIVLVPLIQLVPLPASLWTATSGGRLVASAEIETGASWRPLSLAPHATWLSAVSLLVPLAMFWSTLQLSYQDRRVLSLVLLTAGVFSAFLGLLQLAQGPESAFRFYEITNFAEAVGFFANRNHLAALLYCALLFGFAWTAAAVVGLQASTAAVKRDAAPLAGAVGAFATLVILISAIVMVRSRTGVLLSIVAIFAGLLLPLAFRGATAARASAGWIIGGACALSALLLTQFGLFRMLQRFDADPLQDARVFLSRNTLEAGHAFFPTGSGLGSFVRVFGLFEKPENAIANTYVNHAHNDFFELYLETGALGAAVALLVGLWLAIKIVRSWALPRRRASPIDTALARAAGVAVVLMVLHSYVDYPLRTAAMMAVFAFMCGLLVEPPGVHAVRHNHRSGPEGESIEGSPHHDDLDQPTLVRSPAISPLAAGPSGGSQGNAGAAIETSEANRPAPASPGRKWGTEVEWPKAWQEPGKGHKKPE